MNEFMCGCFTMARLNGLGWNGWLVDTKVKSDRLVLGSFVCDDLSINMNMWSMLSDLPDPLIKCVLQRCTCFIYIHVKYSVYFSSPFLSCPRT